MNAADVLVRPLITEKTQTQLHGESIYAFEVAVAANKVDIKKAIEAYFGVKVDNVRTLIVRGKIKRHGRFHGKRNNWKKAYVRLVDGATLNLHEV